MLHHILLKVPNLCSSIKIGTLVTCHQRLSLIGFKYLSPGVNSLGKGNEFRRRESRVNSFLGMGNYCNQVSTINTTQNAK